MTMPRRSSKPEPLREFPRDVVLRLPTNRDCCTPEETAFWKQTLSMTMNGKTPREVAEFAASGLDDPMLVRAYNTIRDATRRWARMGDTWAPWDNPDHSDFLRTIPKACGMGGRMYDPAPANSNITFNITPTPNPLEME
jgi:hypothetical protein